MKRHGDYDDIEVLTDKFENKYNKRYEGIMEVYNE